MKINNLNFQTWSRNHCAEHETKWCRELYPWIVFSEIDFSYTQIEKVQSISFNRIAYEIIISRIELQENSRYKATFDFFTKLSSNKLRWEERAWNTTFQIVYTQSYDFITVFTKKEDPSKDLVSRFMKCNFTKIYENKSIPISELLFKSLISYIIKDNDNTLSYYQKFDYLPQGCRELQEHQMFKQKKKAFYPLYSMEREIWITYCFNEEKAHRIAFSIANQCKHLIVIYCNPTYTKHHRCKYEATEIISLYEFSNAVSPVVRIKYEKQIKFLQNYLNIQMEQSIPEVLQEIRNPSLQEYEIYKSDLMEALGIMKINVTNVYDALYFFASMNLINAWLSRKRLNKHCDKKVKKLFKNMYYFKTYIQNVISNIIKENYEGVKIYIDNNLVMIDIYDFVFSFHNIPLNEVIINYSKSNKNKVILWSGKRLQPIAPLILYYARNVKSNYYKEIGSEMLKKTNNN